MNLGDSGPTLERPVVQLNTRVVINIAGRDCRNVKRLKELPPTIGGSSLSLLTLRQSRPAILITTRVFSCTTGRSKVGPESPKFIELPRPPQRYAIPRRDIKGTLPAPR